LLFIKHEVKVNGQYCWDILLSQQMLDAMKRVIDNNFVFLFCTDASCVQRSPTTAVQNSTSFLLTYGPITAQSLTPL